MPTIDFLEEISAVRRRADRNAHGHIAQALRLKFSDDIATFAATVGGALVMTGSAILLGSSNSWKDVEAALFVVASLITLVSVWQAVWQPGARSRDHKIWAIKFTAVENECRLVQCGQSSKSPDELHEMLLAVSTEADLIAERLWRRARGVSRSES